MARPAVHHDFNPRSSCEERPGVVRCRPAPAHFNPRSSCEERRDAFLSSIEESIISIHAPHARSDDSSSCMPPLRSYFNPRSSCEERLANGHDCGLRTKISIHAPHARSDAPFSIVSRSISAFQSTLLMRGATMTSFSLFALSLNFNPRSSCEERRPAPASAERAVDFNPRSSCEERRGVLGQTCQLVGFQSTLLMRGAT